MALPIILFEVTFSAFLITVTSIWAATISRRVEKDKRRSKVEIVYTFSLHIEAGSPVRGNWETEADELTGDGRGAKHQGVGIAKGHDAATDSFEKNAFRARVLRDREIDTVGEALILRGKSPEESIEIMFEMAQFVEELGKVAEGA